MSDAPGSDSKLVARAADQVINRGAVWLAGILCSVLAFIASVIAKVSYDGIVAEFGKVRAEIRLAVEAIDGQRSRDMDALIRRIEGMAKQHEDLRREFNDRGFRLTAVETTATRNTAVIMDMDRRIQKIAEDVAWLRARNANGRDRPNAAEPPPPVIEPNRIPMLWHF